MTDNVHVLTKAARNDGPNRQIAVSTFINPTSEMAGRYRTDIDPIVIRNKSGSYSELKVLDLAREPITSWQTGIRTDLGTASVQARVSISPGSVKPTIIIPCYPGQNDTIGSSLTNMPVGDSTDQPHKVAVTDLKSCSLLLDSGVYVPETLTSFPNPVQLILHPISSRHITIDKFGVIHLVYTKVVANYARVLHAWSVTGGDSWSAKYADSGVAGFHYITPSITCDGDGGLHLVYSSDHPLTPITYLLFAGDAVPAGYTLVSGPGGFFEARCICGWETSGLSFSDGPNPAHIIYGVDFDGSGNPISNGHPCSGDGGPNYGSNPCGGHTLSGALTKDWVSEGSLVPPYRSLKLLRHIGIPQVIPKDAVLIFDTPVPAGFTRYSAQDGKYIRVGNDYTATGGQVQHRHYWSGSLAGQGYSMYNGGTGVQMVPSSHGNSFSAFAPYQANMPPTQDVYLGKADNDVPYVPASSIFMFQGMPSTDFWQSMSGLGEPLNTVMLRGANGYGYAGGTQFHDHGGIITTGTSTANSMGFCAAGSGAAGAWPLTNHGHTFRVTLSSEILYPAIGQFLLAKSKVQYVDIGKNVWYRYKPPGGSWTAPVSLTNSTVGWEQLYPTILQDPNKNLHALYSDYTASTWDEVNGFGGRKATVKHMMTISGNWQAAEAVSNSTVENAWPSMDLDKDSDLHTAWYDATNMNLISYRRRVNSTGLWEPLEAVASGNYLGWPSNIATGADKSVNLTYLKYLDPTTKYYDLYYSKRTTTWSVPANLSNKAASNRAQWPGQISLDSKGNLLAAWSGTGYGANPDYYRIVYRNIKVDGTITPALTSDAGELFTNEAAHDIFPCVFWNPYPKVDSVDTNRVVDGITILDLQDVRGSNPQVADLWFYSDSQSTVGDGGNVLQIDTRLVNTRGNICRTNLSQSTIHSKTIT